MHKSGVGSGLIFAFGVAACAPMPTKEFPSAVNGTYINQCGNPLILRDGVLEYSGQKVPYDVERSKNAYAIKTSLRIIAKNGCAEIENGPMEFYLLADFETPPETLEISGYDEKIVFRRIDPSR
jgi:hypothetical protein